MIDAAGCRGHDKNAITHVDGFIDVVGDEKNRFLFALPDAHQIGAHFFAHKRVKEIVFFPVSGSDSLTI